ncbi:MAG: hypothetical protein ACK5EW_06740 [Bacteroidota bacterium]|jgi:hypothetical protein|nr:hypothetical protein [Bacteroidota bacterium]
MISFFGKKKISAEKTASFFVNTLLDAVEEGFPEVAGFVRDSPEFVKVPVMSDEEYGKFLMIVIVGNFNYLHEHFQDGEAELIIGHCVEQFAPVFDLSPTAFQTKVNEYKKFMAHINAPSKNNLYAMSRAVFYKYELNQYQDEYFMRENAPNPIFKKNLDDVMRNFVWDWSAFTEKYKVQISGLL